MRCLETRGLGVERGGRRILFDVSVSFRVGEVSAVVGPNGAGKSTLLRTLAGLLPHRSGDVALDGSPIRSWPRREVAKRIAYVPQEAFLDFEFTVSEVVAMGRYPHRGRLGRETDRDRAAVRAALERADLVGLETRPTSRLSGGERRRVLIARALAAEASCLLLDEPTANLDVDHGLDLLDLCRDLAEAGRAVVLATHDLSMVLRFADRAVLFASGRLVSEGTPAGVLAGPAMEQVFRVRTEAVPAADGTPALLFRRRPAGAPGTVETPPSDVACIREIRAVRSPDDGGQ